MTWFRIDDNLAFHPKALRAGNAALGMWVRAGSWSSQQLTEGFIPDEMIPSLGGAIAARKLVSVGLWLAVDGGYLFHQWGERQPSKAKVEQERKDAAMRKERWKERRQNAVPNGVPNGDGTAWGTPTPTRPDPSTKSLYSPEHHSFSYVTRERGDG